MIRFLLIVSLLLVSGCAYEIKQAVRDGFKEGMQELIDGDEPFFKPDGSCPPMKCYRTHFEGHKYLSFNASHGLSVLHDPDCECFQGELP